MAHAHDTILTSKLDHPVRRGDRRTSRLRRGRALWLATAAALFLAFSLATMVARPAVRLRGDLGMATEAPGSPSPCSHTFDDADLAETGWPAGGVAPGLFGS